MQFAIHSIYLRSIHLTGIIIFDAFNVVWLASCQRVRCHRVHVHLRLNFPPKSSRTVCADYKLVICGRTVHGLHGWAYGRCHTVRNYMATERMASNPLTVARYGCVNIHYIGDFGQFEFKQ